MKKRSAAAAALVLSALCGAGVVAPSARGAGPAGEDKIEVNDAVVAVVNRQVVTRKELVDRASSELVKLDRNLPTAARKAQVQEILARTLRGIVDEKLLVAEGNRLVNASEGFKKQFEQRVTTRLDEERRKRGGEVAFRESLRKEGMTYTELTDRLRDNELQKFVLYQFVWRDLTVSPREVLDFYKEHQADFSEPTKVKCRQIFIEVDKNRSRDEARRMADDAMAMLRKQYDFAKLASERSDLRAKEGGLWDLAPRGTFVKPVDDLVFSLEAGVIGGPVEWEKGFTIVKVEERKAGRTKPFEEVQGEIEKMLTLQKQNERYDALIKRLEKENYVELEQVSTESAR